MSYIDISSIDIFYFNSYFAIAYFLVRRSISFNWNFVSKESNFRWIQVCSLSTSSFSNHNNNLIITELLHLCHQSKESNEWDHCTAHHFVEFIHLSIHRQLFPRLYNFLVCRRVRLFRERVDITFLCTTFSETALQL